MLNRVRVAWKIGAVVGLGAMATVVVGVGSFVLLERVKVNGPVYREVVQKKDVLADILPPPLYVVETYLLMHELERADGMPEVRRLMDEVEKRRVAFGERIAHWEEDLPPGAIKQVLTQTARREIEQIFEIYDREVSPALLTGRAEDARAGVANVAKVFTRHQATVNELAEQLTAAASRVEAEAAAQVRGAAWMIGVGSAGAVSVVLTLGLWMALAITRPMQRVTSAIRAIADGNGDLTKQVPAEGADEVAELGRSFNAIIRRLSETVGSVREAGESVAGSAARIAAAAEEMAAASSEVTRQAAEATELVERSASTATSGREVVSATAQEMRALERAVSESGESVRRLGSRSEEIGQVIEVIDSIADQTNLLALNAAIEAARAGEHGRGFAVVADEVRKLAERTTKATEEVSKLITSIQAETATAAEQMGESSTRMSSGVERASAAGQQLEQICRSSSEVSHTVRSIAAAAEQADAGARESARVAAALSSDAQRLRELVRAFGIG